MLSERSPHRTIDELMGAQPRAGGVKVRGPTQFKDYREEGGDGGAMKPQQPASSDAGERKSPSGAMDTIRRVTMLRKDFTTGTVITFNRKNHQIVPLNGQHGGMI